MKKKRKRTIVPWAVLAALLIPGLTACRQPPSETGGGTAPAPREAARREVAPPGPAADAPEAGHAADGDDSEAPDRSLVRIAPEMLRDLKLTLAAAESRPARQGVTALGELRIDEGTYAALAPPIPAQVVALHAEPGQQVRRGQVLAELQSVELGRARAEHESAAARAELARQTLARKRGLAAERIVSAGELQQAEAAAGAAAAELQAARAGLRAFGVDERRAASGDPSRFALTAPIAGTVLERSSLRGEMADPSRPLFRLADLSRLWLVAQVFERDAVRLAARSTAEITFAALPGRTFRGTVARVGGEVASESRTVAVRIDLPNPDGLLRPGMSATAWLPLADSPDRASRVDRVDPAQPADRGGRSAPVVTVPAAALQRLEERWVVFVPRGPGRFEVREVGRGRDLGGELEILSGLAPGTTVVVDGAFLLKAEADKAHGEGEHHHH